MKNVFRTALLILSVFFIFLFAGCDNLIGPEGPVGPQGPQGAQGPAGNPVPAAIITLIVPGNITPDLRLVAVFDDNEVLYDEGNEHVFTFPLAEYVDSDDQIRITRTFEFLNVPAGSYYFYAFFDFDNDGQMESTESSWLFGEDNYYINDNVNMIEVRPDYPGLLIPNYYITQNSAAQLNFLLEYPW